jgi:hypothetical protein
MKTDNNLPKLILLVLAIPLLANGQATSGFFGTSAVVPNDQLKKYSKAGLGANFSFEVAFHPRFSAFGSIGLVSFSRRNYPMSTAPYGMNAFSAECVPIQAGGKYFLSESMKHKGRFFVAAELGVSIFTIKNTYNGATISTTDTNPSFAPAVGFRLSRLELSFRQQYIFSGTSGTYNYWDFRIGLTIPHFSFAYGAHAPTKE